VTFHFNTRVLQQKKSLLTYHTIRLFALFWALFCFINHIHSKLTTFTLWLRDHKQYRRHLKYFLLCSKYVYWLQFVLVGCSSKTMCPELSYFLWITSCTFLTLIHFTNEYSPDFWDANLLLHSKFCRKYIPELSPSTNKIKPTCFAHILLLCWFKNVCMNYWSHNPHHLGNWYSNHSVPYCSATTGKPAYMLVMNEMDNHKEDWSIDLGVGDISMSVLLKKHLINKEKIPVKHQTT